MRVAFRADASGLIGSGHVMRCMTLANALRRDGADVSFVARAMPDRLRDRLAQQGHSLHMLPQALSQSDNRLSHAGWLGASQAEDAAQTLAALQGSPIDWLVVDHYAIDHEWQSALRDKACRIMAVDDLADRRHDCDLLLDQNLIQNFESRYVDLVPGHAATLLGPRYALLQEGYAEMHETAGRRERVGRILVFFGDADRTGLTAQVIQAVSALAAPGCAVDVVVGGAGAHRDEVLAAVASADGVTVHDPLPSLAPLMQRADLAIGGAGATSWERLCLRLPALVVTLAENQRPIASELHRRSLARWLGDSDTLDSETLHRKLADVVSQPLDWFAFEDASQVDGRGVARVVEEMATIAAGKVSG